MAKKRIALALDHAWFVLKDAIKKCLLELGYSFDDFGV
jgi:ribose 5-phosphate isomerase RpiB